MPKCCDSSTASRCLFVINLIDFLFCIVFIAVGATALVYSQNVADGMDDYCTYRCAKQGSAVFCNCPLDKETAATTTLPAHVFDAPPIGLIVLGVFSIFKVFLGCRTAATSRRFDDEKKGSENLLLWSYPICILLFIVCILAFGTAGVSVAAANADDIDAFLKEMNSGDPPNYKLYDWQYLSNVTGINVFSEACYAGHFQDYDNGTSHTYNHPLCKFDKDCVRDSPTPAEEECCDAEYNCDTSKKQCVTGRSCMIEFFGKVGGPVAVASFLSLVVQFFALGFACAIRCNKPAGREIRMTTLA